MPSSIFEGMDTPEGLLPGLASFAVIGASFFPMFHVLREIVPTPIGWTTTESIAISAFVCIALKTYIHTFIGAKGIESNSIALCGLLWLLSFFGHYTRPSFGDQYEFHDPFNLMMYVTLFAAPTFAFSKMQAYSLIRRQ